MANTTIHVFPSTKADGPDATKVQPSNWNDGHKYTGGSNGNVLVRDTSDATYGGAWSTNLTYLSNVLAIANASAAVSIGASVASAGALRMAHGFAMKALNNAGAADRQVLGFGVTTTDVVELGNATTNTTIYGAAVTVAGPATFTNTGLKVLDTNASHALSIVPGSDITAARTFTLVTGDANRSLTINGDTVIDNWFDQSVKVAASPTFVNVTASSGFNVNSGGPRFRIGSSNSQLLITNAAETDAPLVQFGGVTASFPALKRSTTTLQVRLADDSAFTGLAAAFVSIGTTPATAGDLRLRHGMQILVRNSGNSANNQLIGYGATAADTVEVGDNGINTRFYGTGWGIGGAPSGNRQLRLTGSFSAASDAGAAFLTDSAITGFAGADIYGWWLNATLVEAASGTHQLLAGVRLQAPTVTAGVATVTNTATLYVDGAMAATVTGANYALWVAAGISRFGGTAIHDGVMRLKGYTVATLPAGTQGDTAYATDLLAPTLLGAAVGGGAVVGPVFYNGTTWVTI
jgi:hypothetical protein